MTTTAVAGRMPRIAALWLAVASAGAFALFGSGCAQDEKPVVSKGDLSAEGLDALQARIKELEAKAKALPTDKPHQIAASSTILRDLNMVKIEVATRKNALTNTLPEPTHKRVLEMLTKVEYGIANFPMQ